MVNLQDRRVKRTQKLIRTSFIELLLKHPINEITIQMIADRADINRRTFYLHYTDIYDLLSQTEDFTLNEFSQLLERFELPSEPQIVGQTFFRWVLSYVQDNESMLRVLCRNPDSQLMNKLVALTVTHGKRVIPFQQPENADYILNYCCWGLIGVLHTALFKPAFDAQQLALVAEQLLNASLRVSEIKA